MVVNPSHPYGGMVEHDADAGEWAAFVNEHRAELERLAASDYPAAWVAQKLLDDDG